MTRYHHRAHAATITITCPRDCDGCPCDDEIELAFTIEPYYPARLSGPPERCSEAEGGERELTDTIPAFCSRLHLFTADEQRALDVAAARAMDAYEGDDDY